MSHKNRKVLIYSGSQDIWGGGQIYIEQLCKYLNKNNIEAYIITPEPEKFNCPIKQMDSVKSKKKRFFSAFNIAKKYKKESFQTIILNDLGALWLAPIFRLYGYNVISLLHLYLQKKVANSLGHSIIEYYILKFSSKFCNNIFSVNKDNIKVFGKKVKFIGNYVPNWFFRTKKYKNSKQYDFILIARLSKQKNIPLFLEILKNLNKNEDKKYNALIVGEGPEKDTIERKIREYKLENNIKLMNWVSRDKLPSIYDLGKCFVISSYHEGFATTLLEAHARGLPAIVTKSSGFCGEYIQGYNAITGIVFEFNDVNNLSFYQQVVRLIDNYMDYEEKCIVKAKIFSEENVLKPILDKI